MKAITLIEKVLNGEDTNELVERKSSPKGMEQVEDALITVYDSGPDEGADRYTVVMHGEDWEASANPGFLPMLGFSGFPEHPQGFSQWTEGQEGPHLGKRIKFSDLSPDLQQHLCST